MGEGGWVSEGTGIKPHEAGPGESDPGHYNFSHCDGLNHVSPNSWTESLIPNEAMFRVRVKVVVKVK